MPRYASYVICTSPRSGSTLLCKLLAATGVSGEPNSHFHNPSLDAWLKTYELREGDYSCERETLRAIFDAARTRGTGDTGMFGLRMQRGSFEFFIQQADVLFPDLDSDVDRFEAAFGRTLFIYLTRPDKVEQAISLVKAHQTGLWHMGADGVEIERSFAPKKPYYDADAISESLAELTGLEEAWLGWFEQEGVEPLRVSYDALSGDPVGTLALVLDALGLDGAIADNVEPPTRKLADDVSLAWAERYR